MYVHTVHTDISRYSIFSTCVLTYVCMLSTICIHIHFHALNIILHLCVCASVCICIHTGLQQQVANTLTEATLELYNRIIKELPPTPSKFHYIFNLRDLSRIYHGLCLTTPDRFDSKELLVRVWRNECLRVFYDRLTTDKDKQLVSVSVLNMYALFDPTTVQR